MLPFQRPQWFGRPAEHGNSSRMSQRTYFKVKDKYAGKKGLCPHCEGQVIVQVPDALTASPSERHPAARSDPAAPGRAASPAASIVERFARVRRSGGGRRFRQQRHERQPVGLERDPAQHQMQVRPACADVVRPLPGVRAVSGSLSRSAMMPCGACTAFGVASFYSRDWAARSRILLTLF